MLFNKKQELTRPIEEAVHYMPLISPLRYFDRDTIERFLSGNLSIGGISLIRDHLSGVCEYSNSGSHWEGKKFQFDKTAYLFSTEAEAKQHGEKVILKLYDEFMKVVDKERDSNYFLTQSIFAKYKQSKNTNDLDSHSCWIFALKGEQDKIYQLVNDFIAGKSCELINYVLHVQNKDNLIECSTDKFVFNLIG